MDFSSVLQKSEPHARTIIHLDMDCYYAQVEELREPSLRGQPVGVLQKNTVVTCNYAARAFGVTKLMLVDDATKLCPGLVLVNGEDLTPYRQMSQRVFELLLNYTPAVEKLGLDEQFLDVSELVQRRMSQLPVDSPLLVGHTYPSAASSAAWSECLCGCASRLSIGTQLAQELRDDLQRTLGLSCCAGIAHNKLLAKLVGARHKPSQQTVLVPTYAEQFMRELGDLGHVTGIGMKTSTLLLESGVNSVQALQLCNMDLLRKKFGFETATKLKDLAFGRDNSDVRPTGKPKTISTEDSCRPISVRADVEEKFRLLLVRLTEQVAEDGRIPTVIKVVLRKFDPQKKNSSRETKQANILASLFRAVPCESNASGLKVQLAEGAQAKLLKIVMRLFERCVNLNKPFSITLLGLAFSKFQNRKTGSSSIANFLIKKTDIEVQSITSIVNRSESELAESSQESNSSEVFGSSPNTFQPSDQFYRRRATTASPVPMLVDNGVESATNSDFSDISETEVEPSPKKSRIGRLLLPRRSGLAASNVTPMDIASPSKLRVSDLRLNSRDSEKDYPCAPSPPIRSKLALNDSNQFSTQSNGFALATTSLLMEPAGNHDICNTPPDSPPSTQIPIVDSTDTTASDTNTKGATTKCLEKIPCPAGVDPQVFDQLPADVQDELITSWRNSLAAAAAAVARNRSQDPAAMAVVKKATQKNTLYRYFLRNK